MHLIKINIFFFTSAPVFPRINLFPIKLLTEN